MRWQLAVDVPLKGEWTGTEGADLLALALLDTVRPEVAVFALLVALVPLPPGRAAALAAEGVTLLVGRGAGAVLRAAESPAARDTDAVTEATLVAGGTATRAVDGAALSSILAEGTLVRTADSPLPGRAF